MKKKKEKRNKTNTAPSWSRLPLLPEHGINFITDGQGDADKFVRVFRKAWNCLPSENRQQLVKYWQKRSTPRFKRPHIDLANRMGDFRPIRCSRGKNSMPDAAAYAICASDGTHLAFWQPLMDKLPVKHAVAIVVHELAHALAIISGAEKKNPALADPDMLHVYIHAYLLKLGIDQIALHKWIQKNTPELLSGQKNDDE